MSKKLFIIFICCFFLNVFAKRSSIFNEIKINKIISGNKLIPDGTYQLSSIYICENTSIKTNDCQFERYLMHGSGTLSLSRLLDGQYLFILQGHSTVSKKEANLSFGCEKGKIEAFVFFDYKTGADSVLIHQKAVSAVSSQVRISENTCDSLDSDILRDGNFIGNYFYFHSMKKLYLQQNKILKNRKLIRIFTEFEQI